MPRLICNKTAQIILKTNIGYQRGQKGSDAFCNNHLKSCAWPGVPGGAPGAPGDGGDQEEGGQPPQATGGTSCLYFVQHLQILFFHSKI